MKHYLATFSNDQVNRYGWRFSVGALESCLKQGWGGAPMFISHDYHRPVGISKALAIHLHASQAVLKGLALYPETEEEQEVIVRYAQKFLAEKLTSVPESDAQELNDRLRDYISPSALVMARECTCIVDTDIVKRVLPQLFTGEMVDKDGLVNVKELREIGPGVFEIDGFAIFAHRYYRRTHSQINNLNSIFLSKLSSLRNYPDLDVKIALDSNSIGLPGSYRTPIELQFWGGPKFNDDLTKIKLGVTRHKATERERMFFGIAMTDFWWHKKNGKYSMECEELRDTPTIATQDDMYGCRYVHSIVDEQTNLPNHLDGAIREYSAEDFLSRIDVDISKAGSDSHYVKIWRVDGPIKLAIWKELICDFFRDNPLPGEYLMGLDSYTCIDDLQASDTVNGSPVHNTTDTELTPLQPPKDVHLSVSYHNPSEYDMTNEGSVISFDWLTVAGHRRNVIDMKALSLIRLVERDLSMKLAINDNISFIMTESSDVNFPILLFKCKDAITRAQKSLLGLHLICKEMCRSGDQCYITASIGIQFDQVIAVFSFAGFVDTLAVALQNGLSTLPQSFEEIGDWSTRAQDILRNIPGYGSFMPELDSMLEKTGNLTLPLATGISELVSVDETGQIIARFPKRGLAESVQSGELKLAAIGLVQECECLSCGDSYLACDCVSLIDKNGGAIVHKYELLGFCLTRRRASVF